MRRESERTSDVRARGDGWRLKSESAIDFQPSKWLTCGYHVRDDEGGNAVEGAEDYRFWVEDEDRCSILCVHGSVRQ